MDNQETARKIQQYLTDYVKNKCKEKIIEKIIDALGVTSYYNLVTGNFSAARLAGFTVSMLRAGYFYGYFQMHGDKYWNPYNPRREVANGSSTRNICSIRGRKEKPATSGSLKESFISSQNCRPRSRDFRRLRQVSSFLKMSVSSARFRR